MLSLLTSVLFVGCTSEAMTEETNQPSTIKDNERTISIFAEAPKPAHQMVYKIGQEDDWEGSKAAHDNHRKQQRELFLAQAEEETIKEATEETANTTSEEISDESIVEIASTETQTNDNALKAKPKEQTKTQTSDAAQPAKTPEEQSKPAPTPELSPELEPEEEWIPKNAVSDAELYAFASELQSNGHPSVYVEHNNDYDYHNWGDVIILGWIGAPYVSDKADLNEMLVLVTDYLGANGYSYMQTQDGPDFWELYVHIK